MAILIDGNNLIQQSFYSTIRELHDNGDIDKDNLINDYKYIKDDFKAMFFYQVFNNILSMNKYKANYGNIVVALDSKNSWRRRFYPDYKSRRRNKEKNDNEQFTSNLLYKFIEIIEKILSHTNIKVLKTMFNSKYGIEGDDIIAVLAMYLQDEKHIIYSIDVDFYQILNDRIKQYHPLERKIIDTPTKRAVDVKMKTFYLKGQAKDSVPSIKYQTELSTDFIKFVKKNYEIELRNDMIDKVIKNHKDIVNNYKEETEKDIYKKSRFTEDNLKLFFDNLEEMLDTNKYYKHNYKRNLLLLSFYKIPESVKNKILEEYESLEDIKFLNKIKLRKLFLKAGATKVADMVDQF